MMAEFLRPANNNLTERRILAGGRTNNSASEMTSMATPALASICTVTSSVSDSALLLSCTYVRTSTPCGFARANG